MIGGLAWVKPLGEAVDWTSCTTVPGSSGRLSTGGGEVKNTPVEVSRFRIGPSVRNWWLTVCR